MKNNVYLMYHHLDSIKLPAVPMFARSLDKYLSTYWLELSCCDFYCSVNKQMTLVRAKRQTLKYLLKGWMLGLFTVISVTKLLRFTEISTKKFH